jgi:hypothetical protein
VIATITPPTVETESDDIEVETAVVGEDGEKAEGDAAEEAADSAADSDDKS